MSNAIAALSYKLDELYPSLTPEQVRQVEEIQAYYYAGIYNLTEWYYKILAVIDPAHNLNLNG